MNKNVRLGLLLLAGGMCSAGQVAASSMPVYGWQGSLDDWRLNGTITDGGPNPAFGVVTFGPGDGDTRFQYIGSADVGGEKLTMLSISEDQVDGRDLYKINILFPQTAVEGAYVDYKVTSLSPINAAALDSLVTLGGSATKLLCPAVLTAGGCNTATAFLTLTSIDSVRVPSTPNFQTFEPMYSFYVRDVFTAGKPTNSSNEFTFFGEPVPEIDGTGAAAALTLLAGILGLSKETRRRPRS